MKTKLTLSIDPKVVQKARNYAKQNGDSVSQIVESYLVALTQDRNEFAQEESVKYLAKKSPLTTELKKLANDVKIKESEKFIDDKAFKSERLKNKYLD